MLFPGSARLTLRALSFLEKFMPSYFSDGNNPKVEDTRWRVLEKIVGVLYAATPLAGTAPERTDTRWKLLRKWNALRNGTPLT